MLIIIILALITVNAEVFDVDVVMPSVKVDGDNALICVQTAVPDGEDVYIIDIESHPPVGMYHHMTLGFCREPGSSERVWDCGESHFGSRQPSFLKAPACMHQELGSESESVTYSYTAREVTDVGLRFLTGTGQKVGTGTAYKYILMYTHFPEYKNLTFGVTKETGIRISYSRGTKMMLSSAFALIPLGILPPRKVSVIRGSFEWKDEMPITIFSANVHAHALGLLITVMKVSQKGNQELIISTDPIDQRFHQLDHQITVTAGDRISMDCWYNNTHDESVVVKQAEMCAATIFYYVTGNELPHVNLVYTGQESVDNIDQCPQCLVDA